MSKRDECFYIEDASTPEEVLSNHLRREAQSRDVAPGWPEEHMLEAAWGLIANAFGGDWSQASLEWREAAERWRDAYMLAAREEDRNAE